MSKVLDERTISQQIRDQIAKEDKDIKTLIKLVKICPINEIESDFNFCPINEIESGFNFCAGYGGHSMLTCLFHSEIPEVIDAIFKRKDVKPEFRNKHIKRNSKKMSSPVMFACKKRDLDLLKVLVKYDDIDSNNNDKNKSSPLIYLIEDGLNEYIDVLMKSKNLRINDTNKGLNPLVFACSKNNSFAVKKLLSHPDIDISQKTDSFVMFACKERNYGLLKVLVKYDDIDSNNNDKNKSSPLIYLIKHGLGGYIDVLMKSKNLRINDANKGLNPLVFACSKNNISVVKKLLSHPDIDISQKTDSFNSGNVFHIICQNGYYDMLMILLEFLEHKKVYIDLSNNLNETFFELACDNQFKYLVKAILDYKGPTKLFSTLMLEQKIKTEWSGGQDVGIYCMLIEFKKKNKNLLKLYKKDEKLVVNLLGKRKIVK
jgi:ankyrin repeat protein